MSKFQHGEFSGSGLTNSIWMLIQGIFDKIMNKSISSLMPSDCLQYIHETLLTGVFPTLWGEKDSNHIRIPEVCPLF